MQSLDPVILFFILGVIAQIAKSDLRIPEDFYNTLSIYLLLAIGIKGGIELSHTTLRNFIWPAVGTILLGPIITFTAFGILRRILKFDRMNSISIAAHYGSCSAVTFAVVTNYLSQVDVPYEEFSTVLLVLQEIPGIAVAILIAALGATHTKVSIPKLLHEVFLGKSILLLVCGLIIGMFITYTGTKELNFFFFDLFKGFLAIFMLEMGIVTAQRLGDLKKVGIPLVAFGLTMPFIAAVLGIVTGILTGLSPGGTVILATLSASASYIAAPAAMQLVLPNANPTYSLTASLGITFPFNIVFGIQIYHYLTEFAFNLIEQGTPV